VDKNADGRIGEEEVKEVSNKQTGWCWSGVREKYYWLIGGDWWLESGAEAM